MVQTKTKRRSVEKPKEAVQSYRLDDAPGFLLRVALRTHTAIFAAKMIEELTHELNKVEPNNALPVAPFPRVKGARSIEDSLGDSVRGLFQSADFQGALGLGPANSYAKQQLDTQQAIVTEIKGLRTDIQNNPGALWG